MKDKNAVKIMAALAQTTRLRVFRLLMISGKKGMAAGKIAKTLDVPQSTLSSHLKILESAGILTSERQERKIVYRAEIKKVRSFVSHIVNDCCDGHKDICTPTIFK
jgi:DNA-binding transcriptional ArsR family regulator